MHERRDTQSQNQTRIQAEFTQTMWQTVAKTKRRIETCLKSKRTGLFEAKDKRMTNWIGKEAVRKKNYQEEMKQFNRHLKGLTKKLKEQDVHVEKQKELMSTTMEMKKEKNNWRFVDNEENNQLLKQKRNAFNDKLMMRITKPGPNLDKQWVEYQIK